MMEVQVEMVQQNRPEISSCSHLKGHLETELLVLVDPE